MAEKIGPLYLNPDGGITHIDGGTETAFDDEALATAVLTAAGGVEAITGPQGPAGSDGADGRDGTPGADGAAGRDGADGADGVGVPAGGTTGQALVKTSGSDFDTEWATPSGGSVSSDDITDATSTGKAVLTAASQSAARSAIGAGTSSLALGTTSSTALRGDTDLLAVGTAATDAAAGTLAVNVAGSPSNPHTDASAARNTALASNWWRCSTEPTNWTAGDCWLRTEA